MPLLLQTSSRMPYHTDLAEVFRAFRGAQRGFDWLLTDCVCHALYGLDLPVPLRKKELRLTGAELTEIVEGTPLRFGWAVLSGFAPGSAPEPENVEPYPFADGNRALWEPGVRIQHPDAQIEIVCWDSSATLVLARDAAVEQRFRSHFPEAVDLEAHNAARAGAM